MFKTLGKCVFKSILLNLLFFFVFLLLVDTPVLYFYWLQW